MNYRVDINGIMVDATYDEKSIELLYRPLLKQLDKLQKEKNRRILVLLAAPPGAGKSTLVSFLEKLAKDDGIKVSSIGMDGFHHYQDFLLSHTTARDGETIPMVKIKGAPITFDLELLIERIKQLKSEVTVGWPIYNRLKHNPQDNAVFVDSDIVLLEGNYLMLEEEGWNQIRDYADYTIKIIADENMLRERLIARKAVSGTSYDEARSFVEYSDMVNVRTCLNNSAACHMELYLATDNSYSGFFARPLDEKLKRRITGITYPDTKEKLEISYDDLSYVKVLHYDFDNKIRQGEIICNKKIANDIIEIFKELYEQKYQIEKIRLIDEYNADDLESMADNNTSAFNYRVISGTDIISNHSYGLAIDINPLYNPYVFDRNGRHQVQPLNATEYEDRTKIFEHKIGHEDLCYKVFLAHGFTWGGDWDDSKDYQHFEKGL